MSTGRPYHSDLREQRAQDTRERISQAAAELFAERGFAETTVAAIAEKAGVAGPTVYATFGSKAGIILELVEHLEASADQSTRMAAIREESDPYRQLSLFCAWIRALWETGAPVLRAATAARATTPAAAELFRQGDAARLRGARRLCQIFADKGGLISGLEPEAAAEQLWLLTSLDLYFNALDQLGWTPDQYEAWLAETVTHTLLEPRSS